MFRRRRSQDDFSAEVRAHIALETERLRREGLSPTDAELAARRAFGNVTRAEEHFYESGRWLWWDEIQRDLAYSVRALRHSPVFTAAAVLTMALGIGATTAIFSLIDAALLRPLPYPNPDRIFVVYARTADGELAGLSPATFLDYRRQSSSFENLAAFRENPFNLEASGRPERIQGATVTPDFFAVLGVQAELGRTLSLQQDAPGHPRTAVLSDAFWRRRFAASAGILGQTIHIDGEPLAVVGVMPPAFQYPALCDVWKPALYRVPEHPLRPQVDPSDSRGTHYFSVVGRLKPGVTLAAATAEGNAIGAGLRKQYGPDEEMARASLVPLQEDLTGDNKPALLVLLGAVSLLLLIACANVANILLARGATRQTEIAIRGALGAGRARLLRQLLTESLTLGFAGGALGVVVAYLALIPLRALLPAIAGSHLDARVLAFTAALSLTSALLFGLLPALQVSAGTLNAALQEGGRSSVAGRTANRARSLLVASEVALAAVLLIGAGLLLRSFSRLLAVPEGFQPDRVLSLQLSLANAPYPTPAARNQFVRQALDRMAAIPGVSGAAVISRLPLNPGNSSRSVEIKGRVPPNGGDPTPDYLVVSPSYFTVMGMGVLRGRAFDERDSSANALDVIVNQAMARHFWPGRDPIGQSIKVGGCGDGKQWCQVVGVVDNVRQHRLDEAALPAVYVPYASDPWPFMAFVVRTSLAPESLAPAMEEAVHSVDREQAVYNVRLMRTVVSESLSPHRGRMLLIGSFAFLALVLACVGIYGVTSYSVAQRTQEMGVRMALGAGRTDVVRIVVGQGLKLSLAGAAAGGILSLPLTRFLSKMLFGVQPTDAATFAAVCSLLVGTTLVASLVPALRASKVDPLTALRMQ